MLNKARNILIVSLTTVGSRVLGLARDAMIFAALGAGLWSSAFVLAFTLPNLFRRLLGEGALTSAMVPVFSTVFEREGKAGAFRFFNQVLLRLFICLLIITVCGMLALESFASDVYSTNRWALGARLATILLPYMLFICLAAVFAAGLNLLGRFAVAAATPIVLNLCIIGSLAMGMYLADTEGAVVYWLCGGVLVGGFLQCLLPALDFAKQGWRPEAAALGRSSDLTDLWHLFLPGLMGAAILQINIVVSRVLAFSLDETATSVLYLSSRLMELPLGVFTVSVVTVFFPLLARAVAARDTLGFSKAIQQGIRLVVCISFPAGIGLCVLGRPILELLFQYGRFDQTDVSLTIPLIAIYGLGLPFYSAATFATRGLHARKDMRTPLKVAAICLLVNLFCGLLLMQFWGASGLATANVVAAVVQALLLCASLSRHGVDLRLEHMVGPFSKIFVAGVLMGLVCLLGRFLVYEFGLSDRLSAALTVCLFVPGGAALYFAVLSLLRFDEMDLLWQKVMLRFMSEK